MRACQKIAVLLFTLGLVAVAHATPQGSARAGDDAERAAAASSARVNVNTAGAEELMSLPGIGPALAKRIVEYRAQHGPFKRVEDLAAVKGVGPKMLEKLRARLNVDSNGR